MREQISLNGTWQLKGTASYVPLRDKSMETGKPLEGVTGWMDAQVPGGVLPDAQIDQSGAEIPLIPEAALLRRSLACAPNLPHFVRRMENQHIQHEMLRRLQKVGYVKGEILIHALVFAQQMPVQVDHAGIIDTLEVQEGLAVRGDVPAVELAAGNPPVNRYE